MYLFMFTKSIVTDRFQPFHVCSIGYSDSFSHVFYRVNTTVPNDVINVNIITNERFCVVVNVDYTNKSVTLLSEVIKE